LRIEFCVPFVISGPWFKIQASASVWSWGENDCHQGRDFFVYRARVFVEKPCQKLTGV